MKRYWNTSIAILLLLMLGCNNDPQEQKSELIDTVKQDSVVDNTPEAVNLKEMAINAKAILDSRKLSGSKELDRNEISRLSVASMDSTAVGSGDAFKYHVLDTLFSGSKFKILLIGREYPEENVLWIASYDGSSALLDRVQVYYDNAEGNLSMSSEINDNSIIVNIQSEYAEEGESSSKIRVYTVNATGRFVKKP